jgi:DNA mismatch repair protein MutL
VFGEQTLDELIELAPVSKVIPAEEQDDVPQQVRLGGFLSRPQVQKLNRNSIFLFVNGRLIRDRLLLHALNTAYHNIIPPNAYPFALLFLDLPYEEVDVNVHPSKTEVRFRRGTMVHDFVRDSLRAALNVARPVSTLPLATSPQPAARLPYSEFSQAIENEAFRPDRPDAVADPAAAAEVPLEQLPEFTLKRPGAYTRRLDFGSGALSLDTSAAADAAPPTLGRVRTLPDTHGPLPDGAWRDPAPSLEVLRDLRPIGQLHDSFIVALGPDGLWIIDQHVAHERILFEKVLAQMAAGKVERQQLLIPILLDLTPAQHVEYARIAGDLTGVGFEIEPFGPRTLAVKAAPADIGAAEVERVLLEILEIAEHEMREASFEGVRRQMAASIACRAAIKINMPLDAHRMRWLLGALAETQFPMSCPHGRPIALRYSTRDILKGFHRV